MKMRHSAEGGRFWGAHASRVLVSASRRNDLSLCGVRTARTAPGEVRDREDACATLNARSKRQ
jgi:hypothetical protein